LVEYITGMDTRIGYPNEHLAGHSDEDIASPLYATAVGLLMDALERDRQLPPPVQIVGEETDEVEGEEMVQAVPGTEPLAQDTLTEQAQKATVLERWSDKLRKFLENAE